MTDWQTPRMLYDELDKSVGGFRVDAAASGSNTLCSSYYGPDSPLSSDAISVEQWLSPAWCNPPYGRGIEIWLNKFIEQQERGVTVVSLLPARTETRWWYELVVPYASIVFLVGRVPFHDPNRTKPTQPDHGSAVCLFEPGVSGGAVAWLDWKRRIDALREAGTTGIIESIDPGA